LVVEDDASLRAALTSVLSSQGHRVLATGEPDSAYALLAGESVDAVLLDVRLPTMSGLALSLAIAHRWPALQGRIAFMAAYADAPDVRPWLRSHHCTVLAKPFRFEELAHWLAAIVRAQDRRASGD
jgi:DNA-binding response OmpR family regulator